MNDLDLEKIINDPKSYARKISIKNLENLIGLLKDYYYNTDTPLVPDNIYDSLEAVLEERNPDSKMLKLVGASTKESVKLPYPMPSLNKAKYGAGTIEKWINKYNGPYTISHKLDGISLMLYYSKGKLKLYTRGNGTEGQNVSGILKYIDLGTKKLDLPKNNDDFAVRGEAIMSKKTWEKYYEKSYPNVRNWISGVLNSKRPEPKDVKRIQFVAYQILEPRMKHSQQLKSLESMGFHVTHFEVENEIDEAELMVKLDYARTQGEYQIDGLVIVQDKLFDLTVDNPKHSIAFKSMTEEVAQTKVIEVIWKASKRQLLKPTVIIEPVFLSGGNLSKATGHNAKYIVDNMIGPGAVVTIVRSGEVIPYIVEVNKKANAPDLPDVEYEWTEGGFDIKLIEENEEVALAILSHMASVLSIDNLGGGTIKKLVEMGYNEPAEILNMTLEDWNEVPSLGINAEKIWKSIQKLQTQGVWLSQLMDASSAFESGIGRKKMQLILDNFPNILDMIEDQYLIEKLVSIKGVENKTAVNIVKGLSKFQEFLDLVPQIKIKDEDEDLTKKNKRVTSKLAGLRIVFTGIRDKELESLLIQNGIDVATSISKTNKNQVLVAKEPSGTSNKIKQAKELGLQIFSLENFRKFVEKNL